MTSARSPRDERRRTAVYYIDACFRMLYRHTTPEQSIEIIVALATDIFPADYLEKLGNRLGRQAHMLKREQG